MLKIRDIGSELRKDPCSRKGENFGPVVRKVRSGFANTWSFRSSFPPLMSGYRLSGPMYLATNSADTGTEPITGPVGVYKREHCAAVLSCAAIRLTPSRRVLKRDRIFLAQKTVPSPGTFSSGIHRQPIDKQVG